MTLPAELRAEAERKVQVLCFSTIGPGTIDQYVHDDETRALLHRAADALEAAERGVITMQMQADDCRASYQKRYCRQCDAAYSVLSNRAGILHSALNPLPATPEGD